MQDFGGVEGGCLRYWWLILDIFITVFADTAGGMTELASVMLRDCKYDVSQQSVYMHNYVWVCVIAWSDIVWMHVSLHQIQVVQDVFFSNVWFLWFQKHSIQFSHVWA